MSSLSSSAQAVQQAIMESARGLVEREVVVELVALSAVASEHMLLIGPPGTAKSEAVRRIARNLGGRYFEYLLGRFTEPSELFGPINLRKLRDGVVETETAGMLPEAELAFLDEVFLGSTAILNTLLSLLNERTFRRGSAALSCPLRVCVGASNRLPEEDQLAAFADRFLVRAFVAPIGDSRLEELLAESWSLNSPSGSPVCSLDDIDALARVATGMDLGPVRPSIAHAIRLLRGAGITLTDRRAARLQKLVAAAASLAGRDRPNEGDLWPVVFAIPTQREQEIARDVLRPLLAGSDNATLQAAALDSSLGPKARATRITTVARELLASRPDGETEVLPWRLKLEAVAREIDASFAREELPAELAELRTRIVTEIGSVASSSGGVAVP